MSAVLRKLRSHLDPSPVLTFFQSVAELAMSSPPILPTSASIDPARPTPILSTPHCSSPTSALASSFYTAPPTPPPHPSTKKRLPPYSLTPLRGRLISDADPSNPAKRAAQLSRTPSLTKKPSPAASASSDGPYDRPEAELSRVTALWAARTAAGRSTGKAADKDKLWEDDKLILSAFTRLHRHHRPLLLPHAEQVLEYLAYSAHSLRSAHVFATLELLLVVLGDAAFPAPSASISVVAAALVHAYLQSKGMWGPTVTRCFGLLMGRAALSCLHVFAQPAWAESKNKAQKQLTACMLHQALARQAAVRAAPHDQCPLCAKIGAEEVAQAEGMGLTVLSSVELSGLLRVLHAYSDDGQASTRHHAKEALRVLVARVPAASITSALTKLDYKEAEKIRTLAATLPATGLLPMRSPAPQLHRSLPSPMTAVLPVHPSPVHFATLPAVVLTAGLTSTSPGGEGGDWIHEEGLVSPFTSPPQTEASAPVEAVEVEEEEEVVVRVHARQVTPIKLSFGESSSADEELNTTPEATDALLPAIEVPALVVEAPVVEVGMVESAVVDVRQSVKRKRAMSPSRAEEPSKRASLAAVMEAAPVTAAIMEAAAAPTLVDELKAALAEWQAGSEAGGEAAEWALLALQLHTQNAAEEEKWVRRGRSVSQPHVARLSAVRA